MLSVYDELAQVSYLSAVGRLVIACAHARTQNMWKQVIDGGAVVLRSHLSLSAHALARHCECMRSRWQYDSFTTTDDNDRMQNDHTQHRASIPHQLKMDWLAASELIAADDAKKPTATGRI